MPTFSRMTYIHKLKLSALLLAGTLLAAPLSSIPAVAQSAASKTASSAKSTPKLSPVQAEMRRRADAMSVWHKTLMPGEDFELPLKAGQSAKINGAEFSSSIFTAPDEAGNHKLTIFDADGTVARRLTLFVLEPSTSIDKRGYLGEYRIGFYPRNTPKGFIKLEKDEVGLPVSPHFKVGQFLCKQQPGTWPKYVLVSADNLVRLETLLNDLNEKQDTQAETLFVMSGFRTPFYNTAIGSAKFSRHMYGDAADVYVDTKPRDGVMDDINGDGQITKADANFMYDYAQKLYKKEGLIQGGIGSYKANAVHGPFVHIDARGRAARWGR